MDETDQMRGYAGAVREGAPASGAPTVPQPLAGGGSSITHLLNRQSAVNPTRETGGEDTVHLALSVWWRDDYAGLMAVLLAAQESAQQSRGMAELTRGDQIFAVRRAGVKTGQGRGRYFRFMVHHLGTGVVLKISDEAQASGETPNVLAELGSSFLMAHGGIVGAWCETRSVLEALGGYVLWEKLSRVDVCADIPGGTMEPFRSLIFDEHQAVTRAHSRTLYQEGERTTGIALGTGEVTLRIYDKAFEVQSKKADAVKRQLLERLRWNGPQSDAVRVEYQLRRAFFRGIHVDGIANYIRMRPIILKYLCDNWFRIADEVPDRENNNTQRASVHPLWREVQDAFVAWGGEGAGELRRERVRAAQDPIRLVKQARGCLLAALADLGEAPPASLDDLIARTSECLAWDFERSGEVESLRHYRQKRLERGSRGA